MPNYSPPPAIIPQNESQGERMELWPSAGNITSILPWLPLHQLRLTKNNFLPNGIRTTPCSATEQPSSARQLRPFLHAWRECSLLPQRWLTSTSWKLFYWKIRPQILSGHDSALVFNVILFSTSTNASCLPNLTGAHSSKPDWMFSWQSWCSYYCLG